MGIALGLTNLLLRRLVRKVWVRMIHIRPNRVKYLLTPTGIAEKARMSRAALQASVNFYSVARERIRRSFMSLSADWKFDSTDVMEKRIIFFGTGEVAEIGYICLQETDLRLVGAIDNQNRKSFFGIPVYTAETLINCGSAVSPFERLVVMSFDHPENVEEELRALGFPLERVFWA